VRDPHPVRLFNSQQPHHGLPSVLVITGVPTRRNESYSVGFQNPFVQEIITCRRDRYRLDKDFDVAKLHELASKYSTSLP